MCSYHQNPTTNKISAPWLRLQIQYNSTHMNYYTSTSQYNTFLSSITYCIWRVTSLGSVLLVCEVVRRTSKSSFHFMSAGTPTIQLSKNITWWTVYVNVCVYIYTHTHPHVCSVMFTLQLHYKTCWQTAHSLQLHIYYFYYLFKSTPWHMTVMYMWN